MSSLDSRGFIYVTSLAQICSTSSGEEAGQINNIKIQTQQLIRSFNGGRLLWNFVLDEKNVAPLFSFSPYGAT